MRPFLISALLAMSALSGCATISMVPGHTVIETTLVAEQSELRELSNDYVEMAETSHWVAPNPDFWAFAKMLANGRALQKTPKTYAERVLSASEDASEIRLVIATDIGLAQSGLTELIDQAEVLLASDSADSSLRTETYSFESALVTAQKARRNFSEAAYLLEKTSDGTEAALASYFAAFDDVIARAQMTADALAARGAEPTDAGA